MRLITDTTVCTKSMQPPAIVNRLSTPVFSRGNVALLALDQGTGAPTSMDEGTRGTGGTCPHFHKFVYKVPHFYVTWLPFYISDDALGMHVSPLSGCFLCPFLQRSGLLARLLGAVPKEARTYKGTGYCLPDEKVCMVLLPQRNQ